MFPTRLNLELLELNKTVEDAMAVTADREIVTVLPKASRSMGTMIIAS